MTPRIDPVGPQDAPGDEPRQEPSEALKAFGRLCVTLCGVLGEVKSWPADVHADAEEVGKALMRESRPSPANLLRPNANFKQVKDWVGPSPAQEKKPMQGLRADDGFVVCDKGHRHGSMIAASACNSDKE